MNKLYTEGHIFYDSILCEISRIDKSIYTEKELIVAWGWRWEWELTANEIRDHLGMIKMLVK